MIPFKLYIEKKNSKIFPGFIYNYVNRKKWIYKNQILVYNPNEWVNFIKIAIKDHPWKGHELETPNSEGDSDMRICLEHLELPLMG